ncbi:MAG: molybdopterin-binding protein, partial [Veillonella sp.]|nr:molybdopterin-binding protein [Veillonella sp.]
VLQLSEDADIIISSGGVSVGLFDTMPLIYEKLGAKSIYERIQMRPGAASYGAVTPKGQIIFGLSGNPGAAFNGWHLIVAPTLKRYKGLANWTTPVVACVMDSEIFKRNAFDRYVQGKVIFGGGVPRFVANRHFNSSSMLGLYTVNALACIPRGIHEVRPGDTFNVYLLGLLPAV